MGGSLRIGRQKYQKTDMPSEFKVEDVKSKKMQRTLALFDVNKDGVISKEEAEKISLFYKTGSAKFSKINDGKITDYTISAQKAGNNPNEITKDEIDENDNLVFSETTKLNGKVKEVRTDQYSFTHNEDGSVDEIHYVIDSKDRLVRTEEAVIDKNNVHTHKRTIIYSDGKTPGEVNAQYINADGTTETDTYWSF